MPTAPPPDAVEPAGHPWAATPAAWTPIDERMPPEGVVVETDAPGGRPRLKWQGRLWRFPDESHYLFHTPRYWRPLAEANTAGSDGLRPGPRASPRGR